MAKHPSSGQGTGPRPPKAGRKSVTIDLEAEDVGKSGLKSDTPVRSVKKPPKPAAKASPSTKAASEPAKTGPLKADVVKDQTVREQPTGSKAPADKAKIAEGPMKSGASGDGSAKKAATTSRQPDRKPAEPKSSPARPTLSPTVPSAASRLVAAFAGGIIALGGAVALDRLQVLSIFGADSGLSELQTEFTGVKEGTDAAIADLRAQIAALPATGGTDADGLSMLAEKVTQIEAVLTEQSAGIAGADQSEAVAELQARFAALESAVQSGAAGPDAGLAAIEQKLAGVEKTIAGVDKAVAGNRRLAGDAAEKTLAAVKPEIDRLGVTADELAGRITTLEGGLSGLVDSQIVVALGARVEQLADVIDKNAAPQTVAALRSALASESLAAAMAAGRPFAAELDILQSDSGGGPDLTAIAPYAAQGLPDTAALAAEFEALMPILMPPEPERPAMPESTGLVDRLLASARNVVEVREAGPDAGGELTRQAGVVLQALNGNNLKAAQAAWQGLPVEARQASASWAAKLEARLAADALAGALRAEALSRLATAGEGEGQ